MIINEVHETKTLMCPECFHYLSTTLKFNISHNYSRKKSPIIDNFILRYDVKIPIDDLHGICPKCKKSIYWIEIDPGIVRIISMLNKKGYRTRWCCSSHDDDRDAPYIAFLDDLPPEIIKALPKLWHYEPRKYCGAYACIRANEPNNYYGLTTLEQREALFILYDWVKKLPNASKK